MQAEDIQNRVSVSLYQYADSQKSKLMLDRPHDETNIQLMNNMRAKIYIFL